MSRLTVITAIVIAILSPAQRAAVAGRFVSVEGRFSISLPDRPSSRKLTMPTPFGNADGPLYEWKTDEATFGVGYVDSFQPVTDPEIVKQFFDGATERFRKLVTANNGTVTAVKQLTLDKHPGIEQRADLFTGVIIQRMYLVSKRIYETVVVMKNNQREYESKAVEVLDSFKLLSDPEITEDPSKPDPANNATQRPAAHNTNGILLCASSVSSV